MAARSTKGMAWKALPAPVKVAVFGAGAAVVVVGAVAINNSLKARAARERLKNREKSECGGVNLSAVAYNIWDACWNYGGGMMEDEETMVKELLQVPKDCIQSLAMIYNHDFEKNIYEDFRTYVEGAEYEKVRHLLE